MKATGNTPLYRTREFQWFLRSSNLLKNKKENPRNGAGEGTRTPNLLIQLPEGFSPDWTISSPSDGAVGVSGALRGAYCLGCSPPSLCTFQATVALRLAWLRITAGPAAAVPLNSPDFRPASPHGSCLSDKSVALPIVLPRQGLCRSAIGRFRPHRPEVRQF